MATTNLNLQVSFTATYVGEHRVCWRIQGSGDPYDCTTLVMAVLGANITIIFLVVEENYCGPYEFEGYVQPTCVAEGDPSLQTAWTPVQYVNTPDCNPHILTCQTVSLSKMLVTTPGSGFNPLDPAPVVTIAGDATGTAVIGNAGVKTWTVLNAGTGYAMGGTADFAAVTAIITGTGSGAKFDVSVTVGVITALTLTSPGSAFTFGAGGDTFSFTAASLGGGGINFNAIVDTVNTGELQEIVLSFVGTGYNSVPVATVDPLGFGVPPIIIAVLADCPLLTGAAMGPNCDGTLRSDTIPIPLNKSIYLCNPAGVDPSGYPTGYALLTGECCYLPCDNHRVTIDAGGTVDYYYLDCNLVQQHAQWSTAGPCDVCFNAVEGTVTAIWSSGTGTYDTNVCVGPSCIP